MSSEPDAVEVESILPLLSVGEPKPVEGQYRVVELKGQRYWIAFDQSPAWE